jgi:two-component system alkaline phosphatase synthesis response regulator PhoP
MPRILITDDDPTVLKVTSARLKKAGYSVSLCDCGSSVIEKVLEDKPDLILMDVMLGDADGRLLCEKLREDSRTRHIPVILISGSKTQDDDQVSGLQGGADDYLVKPVNGKVLAAKIEAVLRRYNAPQELHETLNQCGMVLDVRERTVKVKGKPVALTRKEFDLLTVLLRKPGKLHTQAYLLETVWGYESETYNNPHTLQVHISRLKKKLGEPFLSKLENVVGSGYRIKE